MRKIVEKVNTLVIAGRNKLAVMGEQTDAGESHVITVIAMCVIGIALVLVLSTALKPMITTMCATMSEKINGIFTGL